MKIVIKYLLVLFLIFKSRETFAQNELNKCLFPSDHTFLKYSSSLNYKYKITINKKYLIDSKYFFSSHESTAIPDPIKHVAFFCRLEDKVFDELNFWVKFRAGDDDSYRKLIEVR